MKKKGKTISATKEKYLTTNQAFARRDRKLFVKRVMVKASIPPSISQKTVCRVL